MSSGKKQQLGMKRNAMAGSNRRIFSHFYPVIPLRFIPGGCLNPCFNKPPPDP